jgi:FkbM family methyltransferase
MGVRHFGAEFARRVGLGSFVDAYKEAQVSDQQRRDRRDWDHMELLIRLLLRENSNCIDIGANIGNVLRLVVERAPLGEHYAVEPVPKLAAALRDAFTDVHVIEGALADKRGTAEFTMVNEGLAYSGFQRHEYPNPNWTTTTIEVQVERLDDVIPADYSPDFIKIDVEGAERDVIAGGLETIKRARPLVIFELGEWGASTTSTPSDIHTLLVEEAGLELFDIDGHGPLTLDETQNIYDLGGGGNFVAVPPHG